MRNILTSILLLVLLSSNAAGMHITWQAEGGGGFPLDQNTGTSSSPSSPGSGPAGGGGNGNVDPAQLAAMMGPPPGAMGDPTMGLINDLSQLPKPADPSAQVGQPSGLGMWNFGDPSMTSTSTSAQGSMGISPELAQLSHHFTPQEMAILKEISAPQNGGIADMINVGPSSTQTNTGSGMDMFSFGNPSVPADASSFGIPGGAPASSPGAPQPDAAFFQEAANTPGFGASSPNFNFPGIDMTGVAGLTVSEPVLSGSRSLPVAGPSSTNAVGSSQNMNAEFAGMFPGYDMTGAAGPISPGGPGSPNAPSFGAPSQSSPNMNAELAGMFPTGFSPANDPEMGGTPPYPQSGLGFQNANFGASSPNMNNPDIANMFSGIDMTGVSSLSLTPPAFGSGNNFPMSGPSGPPPPSSANPGSQASVDPMSPNNPFPSSPDASHMAVMHSPMPMGADMTQGAPGIAPADQWMMQQMQQQQQQYQQQQQQQHQQQQQQQYQQQQQQQQRQPPPFGGQQVGGPINAAQQHQDMITKMQVEELMGLEANLSNFEMNTLRHMMSGPPPSQSLLTNLTREHERLRGLVDEAKLRLTMNNPSAINSVQQHKPQPGFNSPLSFDPTMPANSPVPGAYPPPANSPVPGAFPPVAAPPAVQETPEQIQQKIAALYSELANATNPTQAQLKTISDRFNMLQQQLAIANSNPPPPSTGPAAQPMPGTPGSGLVDASMFAGTNLGPMTPINQAGSGRMGPGMGQASMGMFPETRPGMGSRTGLRPMDFQANQFYQGQQGRNQGTQYPPTQDFSAMQSMQIPPPMQPMQPRSFGNPATQGQPQPPMNFRAIEQQFLQNQANTMPSMQGFRGMQTTGPRDSPFSGMQGGNMGIRDMSSPFQGMQNTGPRDMPQPFPGMPNTGAMDITQGFNGMQRPGNKELAQAFAAMQNMGQSLSGMPNAGPTDPTNAFTGMQNTPPADLAKTFAGMQNAGPADLTKAFAGMMNLNTGSTGLTTPGPNALLQGLAGIVNLPGMPGTTGAPGTVTQTPAQKRHMVEMLENIGEAIGDAMAAGARGTLGAPGAGGANIVAQLSALQSAFTASSGSLLGPSTGANSGSLSLPQPMTAGMTGGGIPTDAQMQQYFQQMMTAPSGTRGAR